MTLQAQKWRDHFALCERDQVQRFPLCQQPLQELETLLLRAQYQIANKFFQQRFPLDTLSSINRERKILQREQYRKATAFRTERASREAFYEHFAQWPPEDYFCLRTEEWEDVFKLETEGRGWENRYATSWHEFVAVAGMSPKQLRIYLGAPLPANIPLGLLFLRRWGTLIHPLGGDGGSDVWHWSGKTLIHLPKHDGCWIS